MAKMKRKRAVRSEAKAKRTAAAKPSENITRSPHDLQKGRLTAREEGVAYGNEPKTVRCEIRLTHQQQQSIEQAANLLGFRNASEYIRYTIQENARKVINDQSILEIAERDRERFMTEITNPKAPGKSLKDAVMQFRKTIESK